MQIPIKVFLIVGARPNFMKIAPIYNELRSFSDLFEPILVHTGQHYDSKMSKVFFDELNLPQPDIYLDVGSGSHAVQTAEIMKRFETELIKHKPGLMIVVGDVNSTIACTLTCVKSRIRTKAMTKLRQSFREYLESRKTEYNVSSMHKKRTHSDYVPIVIHVEAGERSFDFSMPEEINRVTTDVLSDILFTTCDDSDKKLISEGIDPRKIFCVGNVMIDSLVGYLPKINQSRVLEKLTLKKGSFALVTLHRPGNVDEPESLKMLLAALKKISKEIQVVFPMHPRTRNLLNSLTEAGYALNFDDKRLKLMEPLGYIDFLCLQKNAKVILTDSGGIQVESSYLGIPCLTLRPNTEWQITLREGSNTLVSPCEDDIVKSFTLAMNQKKEQYAGIKYWDGETAQRIVDVIKQIFMVK